MAMTRLPRDFKEFLKLLNAHKVEYLLIHQTSGHSRFGAPALILDSAAPQNGTHHLICGEPLS
jgi:hypothetical protein